MVFIRPLYLVMFVLCSIVDGVHRAVHLSVEDTRNMLISTHQAPKFICKGPGIWSIGVSADENLINTSPFFVVCLSAGVYDMNSIIEMNKTVHGQLCGIGGHAITTYDDGHNCRDIRDSQMHMHDDSSTYYNEFNCIDMQSQFRYPDTPPLFQESPTIWCHSLGIWNVKSSIYDVSLSTRVLQGNIFYDGFIISHRTTISCGSIGAIPLQPETHMIAFLPKISYYWSRYITKVVSITLKQDLLRQVLCTTIDVTASSDLHSNSIRCWSSEIKYYVEQNDLKSLRAMSTSRRVPFLFTYIARIIINHYDYTRRPFIRSFISDISLFRD